MHFTLQFEFGFDCQAVRRIIGGLKNPFFPAYIFGLFVGNDLSKILLIPKTEVSKPLSNFALLRVSSGVFFQCPKNFIFSAYIFAFFVVNDLNVIFFIPQKNWLLINR